MSESPVVPCPRLDEHGNALQCPYNDWTITHDDTDAEDGFHFERRACNLCGRCVVELLPGDLPQEE